MKTLTKFFIWAAAVMTLSCTTDATEELNIQYDEGQTTITLSLEESRTHLGEKAGDNYPLYWSTGDQIAVNGVASDALKEEADGKSVATFTFGKTLTYPYNVVYPAPKVNFDLSLGGGVRAEGGQAVTFLATQPYKVGTFADEAAPMYAMVANEGDPILLQHLAGVLRIAPKGEGTTLTSMTVTAERGKIAGAFVVDCATGALTASAEATDVVTVSFGEGLTLGAEATPIYVAVPAGEYGDLTITLHTATDSMIAKFNSDGEKAIKAGFIREFGEFFYNATIGGSSTFLIESKEDLIEFAQSVSNFAPYTSAKVTAPIDMTGEAWTPIEGFTYIFDGGNQPINGLTAPLFASTNGTIKNVVLTDVNISSNNRLIVGAVACSLIGDGSISDCRVSGKITINNPNYALAASYESIYEVIGYGGVVGSLLGGRISKCTNNATIQVDALVKADNEVLVHTSVGGIVGFANGTDAGDTITTSAISDCVNNGAINYHDTTTKQILAPHIGGIIGLYLGDTSGTLSGCTNNGTLDFNAICGAPDTALGVDGGLTFGGIAGSANCTVENNNNYGALSISGGKPKCIHMGGIAGSTSPIKFYNNHNHTTGTLTVDKSVRSWSFNVAGVVAEYTNNAAVEDESIDTCTNDGAINVHGSTDENITTGNYYYRAAGITCYQNFTIRNCENKANGDITVSGDIILARANSQSCYNVAGAYAYMTTAGYPYNVINRGDINVLTNVKLHSNITNTEHCKLNIGGLTGYSTRAIQEGGANYGNITIGKEGVTQTIQANGIYIGGIGAHASSILYPATNEGDVTIHDKVEMTTGTSLWIGGMGGFITGNINSCTNKGDVTYNGKVTIGTDGTTNIGGIIGTQGGSSFLNSSNEGNVTFDGETSGALYMGGCVGYSTAALTITDVNNVGTITVAKDAICAKANCIGGVVGYASKGGTLTRVANASKTGVKYGIVFSRQASSTGGGSEIRIAGIFSRTGGLVTTVERVTNSTGIRFDGYQLGTGGLSIGGLFGLLSNSVHVFGGLVHNSGEIYYTGRCPKSNFGLGGCFASSGSKAPAANFENIVNTGDVNIFKKFDDSYPYDLNKKSMQIAGIGNVSAGSSMANATCYCNLYVEDAYSEREIDGVLYVNSYGFITGLPRNATAPQLSNCKVGGMLVSHWDYTDIVPTPRGELITESNYTEYIYGGTTDWTGVTNYDGCTCIDEAPTIQ